MPPVKRPSSLILVCAVLLSTAACRKTPEIILVVDTEMAVPAELDHVAISIKGPTTDAPPIGPFDLSDPQTPPFPMTLGLTQAGAASPVTIEIDGMVNGKRPDVNTQVRTGFMEGEPRMLRIVLSAACLGVVCTGTDTCSLGKCVAVDRPGESLPSWPGTVPARPDERVGAQSLWVGGWRSCANKGDTLYCWGQNSSGQLGNGFISPDADAGVTTRLPVVGLPRPAASVATGFRHGCIIDTAGDVWCWGDNSEGQLGTGDTKTSLLPVAVATLTECSQIAGGGSHTCAVCGNGRLFCWGRNNEGQVGQPMGTGSVAVLTPQLVPVLMGVVQVRTGENFTCALKTNNTVQCWGDNSFGQLGDGTMTSRSALGTLSLPAGTVMGLSAGRYFGCVVMASGQVLCWGENSYGMVLGTSPGVKNVPAPIGGINDAKQITAGHKHVCALRQKNTVSCWGSVSSSLLGSTVVTGLDSRGVASLTPVDVPGLENVSIVQAGAAHTCARNDAGVFCWGENILGQLGIGNEAATTGPVQVVQVIGL